MSKREIVERLRYCYIWYKQVWRSKNDFNVPFPTKVKYAFRGFSANEYHWYDLKHNNYKDYISDFRRRKSRNINPPKKLILDDKLLFEEIFRNYVRVPKVYAWVSEGNVYGLHGYDISTSSAIDFMRKNRETVLKWIKGYEGVGTFIILTDDEGKLVVNGKPMSDEDVRKLFKFKGEAIITEYMHQSEFENSLYPNAVNTIRMVCAKKKGETTARIIKAAQRIGNDESAPVDNVSAGAIACEIDINTGELMEGVIAKAHHTLDGEKFFSNHPDTGAQLAGKVIPDWDNLKKSVEDVTNKFPFLNFVAWDVLLTDEGFCLIEGNASSGCMMFQQRHGVMNEEIGDIYRSYGF